MKQASVILLSILLLISCRKDKLEGGYEVLQGKWEWKGSTQITKGYSYPTNTYWTNYEWFSAADFSDKYYLEFEKRGKMSIWRNEGEIKFYRLQTGTFEENPQYSLFQNAKHVGLYLNFNYKKSFSASMNEDTMKVSCEYLRLPLELYPKPDPQSNVSYVHTFVCIN